MASFKEARKEAREMSRIGHYGCIAWDKCLGWFAHEGHDTRDIYHVTESGTLWPLTPNAIKFMKKKNWKGVDKNWLTWYRRDGY